MSLSSAKPDLGLVPSWKRGNASSFLVIADIHARAAKESYFEQWSGRLIDDFRRDWSENLENHFKDELAGILIAGDLAFEAAAADYRLVEKFIVNPLAEILGLSHDRIYAVPGNHDQIRTLYWPFRDERDDEHPSLVVDNYGRLHLVTEEDRWASTVGRRFKPFHDWCERHGIAQNLKLRGGPWQREVEVAGQKCCVVGLNSAIASSGWMEKDDPLWVHEGQIKSVFRERAADVVGIAMLHHAPEDLDEIDIEAKRFLCSQFDIVLHGHHHRCEVRRIDKFNAIIVMSPSLGNPASRDGKDPNKRDGFAILRVQKERVQVFFRTHRPPSGGLGMAFEGRTEAGVPMPDEDLPFARTPEAAEVSK